MKETNVRSSKAAASGEVGGRIYTNGKNFAIVSRNINNKLNDNVSLEATFM
jgi:hypothetical protein